jgi:hypothetical protein
MTEGMRGPGTMIDEMRGLGTMTDGTRGPGTTTDEVVMIDESESFFLLPPLFHPSFFLLASSSAVETQANTQIPTRREA